MDLLAATATQTGGYSGLATLTLIILTLGYIGLCVVWPFRACRHCGGYGRFKGPMGGIRLCRRCDGTGLKLRAGRRLWTALSKAYRDLKPRDTRRDDHRN